MKTLTLVAALALSACAGSPARMGEPFPRLPPLPPLVAAPYPQQQCDTYTVDGQSHTICRN